MRRSGSVSFVVEVKRRRFPENGATTSDLDRKSGSRIGPIGSGGLSVTPLVERERSSDPTIEAAKTAAERLFSKPGSPGSARADHWSDPSARAFIPRVELVRPADDAVQKPAGDVVAAAAAQPDGQAEKPRSGRILQSLIARRPRKIDRSPAAWPARAKRRPRRDRGRSAQDARETQHGVCGICRFAGHRRARPQIARPSGRDRSQSSRRYATGQSRAAQEEEGDEGSETSWQPASDRDRKGWREAKGTEAGGWQTLG
jgi:hypothetical protein